MSIKNIFCPTFIDKLNDKYFIVECQHHRIIYNDNLEDDISKWSTINYQFSGCHSIASDGNIYMIENTGANEVIVLDLGLKFKQKFINIGDRPHKTLYDTATDRFYVISSLSPFVYCFKNQDNKLILDYTKKLDFLPLYSYVRSISIFDEKMFITSLGQIYEVNYIDKTYTVVKSYKMLDEYADLNDINKIGEYYYISNSQNINYGINPRIIRTQNLNNLISGEYEDLYHELGFVQTPYFISVFDNKIFIPQIGNTNSIHMFDKEDITKTSIIYKNVTTDANKKIANMFPM